MTKKLKCKCGNEWPYNGQNTSGQRATCPKCRLTVKIPVIVLPLVILLIGFPVTFADEVTVNVPFDSWNIETSMFTGERLDNGTMIYIFEYRWIGSLDQIAEAWQDMIPETPEEIEDVTFPDTEIITIPPIPEDELPESSEEIIQRLKESVEEKRVELEQEKEALIGELAECRTGLGAFGAYQEQEAIESYANKTRWEFSIRDNLSQNITIKKILLAIEECRIMKTYADQNLIGAYELNKYLADLAGLDYHGRPEIRQPDIDLTDSPLTDPLTDRDKAEELDEMERIRDKLIEERVYEDPDAEFTGENRGFQPPGIKCQVQGQPHPLYSFSQEVCPLSAYDAHILANFNTITYKDILQLQCDNFLYIYQHKIGTDEFPVWLNHCVPKVVREG